jgi:hypothetical protein
MLGAFEMQASPPEGFSNIFKLIEESKAAAQLSCRERAAFFINFLQSISLLPSSLETIKLLASAAPSLASSLRLSELAPTQQWLLFTKYEPQSKTAVVFF